MGKANWDAIVVGAGVFGLSVAFELVRAGGCVLVLDCAAPGGGASGGPVGALAPHPPDAWSAKKAFQRDTLLAAEAWWRAVAEASRVDPSYRRIGRLMPLRTPAERSRAERRRASAAAHWPEGIDWQIVEPDAASPWIAPEACPEGAVRETLTARIAPARALVALQTAVEFGGGAVWGTTTVAATEPGRVRLSEGTWLHADTVVVAAGAGSAPLLEHWLGKGAIRGVKGQAARLLAAVPKGAPVIADEGLWVVPHAGGTVGLGSTSEETWTSEAPDAQIDALLTRAEALCPWLAGAEVVERWAGLRPRAMGPEPIVGVLAPGLVVASAGFKTGWAHAPVVADLVVRLAAGEQIDLPVGIAGPQRIGSLCEI